MLSAEAENFWLKQSFYIVILTLRVAKRKNLVQTVILPPHSYVERRSGKFWLKQSFYIVILTLRVAKRKNPVQTVFFYRLILMLSAEAEESSSRSNLLSRFFVSKKIVEFQNDDFLKILLRHSNKESECFSFLSLL